MVTELWVLFSCCKRPPANRAAQVTLRDLEPAGTGTISRSCNWHCKAERQRELWPAAAFPKTCLEHRSVQTEGNFMKLCQIYTFNLFGLMLVYCTVPFIFNNPYLVF